MQHGICSSADPLEIWILHLNLGSREPKNLKCVKMESQIETRSLRMYVK